MTTEVKVGHILVYAIIDGYLKQERYIGASKKNAEKKFKEKYAKQLRGIPSAPRSNNF